MARTALQPGRIGKVNHWRSPSGMMVAETRVRLAAGEDLVVVRVRYTGQDTVGERKLRSKVAGMVSERERGVVDVSTLCGPYSPRASLHTVLTEWLASRPDKRDDPIDGLAVQSRHTYETALKHLARIRLGSVPVGDLTPVLLERLRTELEPHPTTLHQVLSMARQACAHLVRIGVLDQNPTREVRPVRHKRPEPRPLIDHEVRVLFDAVYTHHRSLVRADRQTTIGPPTVLTTFLRVGLGTGLRIGEALALLEPDLHLHDPDPWLAVTGTLVETPEEGLFRQEFPKTESSRRELFLPGWVVDALLDHMRHHPPVEGRIFTGRTGEFRAPSNVRKQWRAAIRGTELEGWCSPRNLRDTHLTRVRDAAGIEAAQAVAGHADRRTTQRSYVGVPRAGDHRLALSWSAVEPPRPEAA